MTAAPGGMSGLTELLGVRHAQPEPIGPLPAEDAGPRGDFADALLSESVITPFLWAAQRAGFEPDPEYGGLGSLTPAARDNVLDSVPQEYWGMLAKARSKDELFMIAGQAATMADSRQRLENMGLSGMALRITAGVLDPAMIAVAIGTGGLGVAAGGLTAGGRLSRMAKAGLILAPIDAAAEVPRALSGDPEAGATDVAFAFAASFALGGLLKGGADLFSEAAERSMKRIELDTALQEQRRLVGSGAASPYNPEIRPPTVREQIEAMLTPEGREHYRDVLSDDGKKNHIRQIAEGFGDFADDEVEWFVNEWDYDDAMDFFRNQAGQDAQADDFAAEIFTTDSISGEVGNPKWVDYLVEKAGGKETKIGGALNKLPANVRPSIGGRAAKASHRNPLVAFAIRAQAQDITSVGGEPLSVWKDRMMRKAYYRTVAPSEELRRAYNANNNLGEKLSEMEWSERIYKAKIEGRLGEGYDPEIQKAVKLYDAEYNKVRDLAEKHGVKSFDEIPDNPAYVNRHHNHAKIAELETNFGHANVVEMVYKSLKSHRINEMLKESGVADEAERIVQHKAAMDAPFSDIDEDWSDDKLRKLADGYLKRVKSLKDGPAQSAFFHGDQEQMLREVLEEQFGDIITDPEIESVVGQVVKPNKDQGKVGFARRRLRLDENYVHPFNNPAHPSGQGSMAVTDMFSNDIKSLLHTYSSSMYGEMGTTTLRRSVAAQIDPSGKLEIKSLDDMIDKMKKHSEAMGYEWKQGDTDTLRFLDGFNRDALPPPTSEFMKKMQSASRLVRYGNLIRIGASFGMAQVPEFFAAMAQGGIRANIQQMPSFRGFLQFLKDGSVPPGLGRDMQTYLGAGADPWIHGLSAMQDGFGVRGLLDAGHTEKLLRKGVDVTNIVSGMRYIDSISRVRSATVGMQNVVNKAIGGVDAAGNFVPGRIRDADLDLLGINRKQWDRISEAVTKEAKGGKGLVTEKGAGGFTVKRFQPDQFEDQDVAAMLIRSVDRWSGTAIQRNDIGQLGRFMHHEVAKQLFQFQTFHLASWDKQLMTFLHNPTNPALISKVLVGGTTAGGIYALQHYARSRTDDDPQAYRDKHLSLDRIVAAGVQRGGTASLMPQFADQASYLFGGDPMFNARNSGQGALQIPSVQFIKGDLPGAARSISQAVRGSDDFSETDAAQIRRLTPFNTAPGVGLLERYLVEKLPDEQR